MSLACVAGKAKRSQNAVFRTLPAQSSKFCLKCCCWAAAAAGVWPGVAFARLSSMQQAQRSSTQGREVGGKSKKVRGQQQQLRHERRGSWAGMWRVTDLPPSEARRLWWWSYSSHAPAATEKQQQAVKRQLQLTVTNMLSCPSEGAFEHFNSIGGAWPKGIASS